MGSLCVGQRELRGWIAFHLAQQLVQLIPDRAFALDKLSEIQNHLRLAFGVWRCATLFFAVAVEFEFSAAHFARIQMTHQTAEALGRTDAQGIDRFELFDL